MPACLALPDKHAAVCCLAVSDTVRFLFRKLHVLHWLCPSLAPALQPSSQPASLQWCMSHTELQRLHPQVCTFQCWQSAC